jgi:type II secretory pathway component GspD/PulD (secretin)
MNIPLLGYLFRSSEKDSTRNELIVLIRPTVLPTPDVAALTAKAENDKLPEIRRMEKEVQAENLKDLGQLNNDLKHAR